MFGLPAIQVHALPGPCATGAMRHNVSLSDLALLSRSRPAATLR